MLGDRHADGPGHARADRGPARQALTTRSAPGPRTAATTTTPSVPVTSRRSCPRRPASGSRRSSGAGIPTTASSPTTRWRWRPPRTAGLDAKPLPARRARADDLIPTRRPRSVPVRSHRATSSRASASPSGSSRLGKWAAFGRVTKRLFGIRSWAARPCLIGMVLSRSPQTISVGSSPEQVEPVNGADVLAAHVDHRAQRLQEGAARRSLLERAHRAGRRPAGRRPCGCLERASAHRRARSPRGHGGWRPARCRRTRPAGRRRGASGSPRGRARRLRSERGARPAGGIGRRRLIAMPPPREWPTIVARSIPMVVSRSRMLQAWAPRE